LLATVRVLLLTSIQEWFFRAIIFRVVIVCLITTIIAKRKEKKWAESEYIEKSVIVISKRDRAFLEYLGEEFKYIVRYKDGTLFAYKDGLTNWFGLNHRFDVDFPMVKWEGNEEIWLIEDLKKLEVVEEYEENSR
jgi:hypothetical protein